MKWGFFRDWRLRANDDGSGSNRLAPQVSVHRPIILRCFAQSLLCFGSKIEAARRCVFGDPCSRSGPTAFHVPKFLLGILNLSPCSPANSLISSSSSFTKSRMLDSVNTFSLISLTMIFSKFLSLSLGALQVTLPPHEKQEADVVGDTCRSCPWVRSWSCRRFPTWRRR